MRTLRWGHADVHRPQVTPTSASHLAMRQAVKRSTARLHQVASPTWQHPDQFNNAALAIHTVEPPCGNYLQTWPHTMRASMHVGGRAGGWKSSVEVNNRAGASVKALNA